MIVCNRFKGESSAKSREELERERQLVDNIIQDLPQDEDEHLDLTLDEERHLLHEYLAYVTTGASTSA